MASIKDYGLGTTAIEEWLPWGGIVEPFVMKQKDGSLFCVIAYEPLPAGKTVLEAWKFRRGWVAWCEDQHTEESIRHYLVLLWNPFYSGARIHVENALQPKVSKNKTVPYFKKVAEDLLSAVQGVTKARLIEYQELMDFISFSLTIGTDHVEMPEIPLYMDVMLSQNNTFEFLANGIRINGKNVLCLSILGLPDTSVIDAWLEAFPFRHVRRLVLMDLQQAKRDINQYTKTWCPSRKILKKRMLDGILRNCNGYYTEQYFLLLPEEQTESITEELETRLNRAGVAYIFESFNLKEVWWGSLPGLFLANNAPPLTGFDALGDIMAHGKDTRAKENRFSATLEKWKKGTPGKEKEKGEQADVSSRPVQPS